MYMIDTSNIFKLCLEDMFTRHESFLDFLYRDREFIFNQDQFVNLSYMG